MGGSESEEFLAPAPVGEDTYVACPSCGYAANVEAVTTAPTPASASPAPLEVLDTPDTPTIETLVSVLNERGAGGRSDWTAGDTLKNVVLTVDGEVLIIGVPGDREVDLRRVEAALHPATVTMFDDFASQPDLVRGYIGPQGSLKARYLVDPRVVAGSSWVTGANEPGRHAVNVVCGRDFTPDGTIEAADVRAGDPCPTCGTGLELRRGIEIGHIFQLGRRFADVFGLDALGPDSKPIRITMGSYGIGLSRAVASIVEQHHDSRGLCWPSEIAPAQVHVVGLGDIPAAVSLAASIESAGYRVLVDDRTGLSAGVKFADAELLGAPSIVVVGRRYAEGYVELRDRSSGARQDVAVPALPESLRHVSRDESPGHVSRGDSRAGSPEV
jgi:prolyl-tRNA synthetase